MNQLKTKFSLPSVIYVLNSFNIVGELYDEMFEDSMNMIKEKLPHISNWKEGDVLKGMETKIEVSLPAKNLLRQVTDSIEDILEEVEERSFLKGQERVLEYIGLYEKDIMVLSSLFAFEEADSDKSIFVKKEHVRKACQLLTELVDYCVKRANEMGLLDE